MGLENVSDVVDLQQVSIQNGERESVCVCVRTRRLHAIRCVANSLIFADSPSTVAVVVAVMVRWGPHQDIPKGRVCIHLGLLPYHSAAGRCVGLSRDVSKDAPLSVVMWLSESLSPSCCSRWVDSDRWELAGQ